MKLKLSDDLKLPIEAVTQKMAWLGTTGSGKTYGASKLAELFFADGATHDSPAPVLHLHVACDRCRFVWLADVFDADEAKEAW